MTRYRERYHQAARDGYLDLLREATRSEADGPDENGMSPVMWAAFYGNVDALRLLIQRGGSPDKTDHMGSSALHFAALNGHMNCVTFLVNFGANIWTLDNDYHTALDLAGLRDHRDIVEYLDGVAGKQVSMNRRVVAKMREKAALDAQKRIKKFDRLMRKTSKKLAKDDKQQQAALSASFNSSSSSTSTMLRSGATSNPNYRHRTRSGTSNGDDVNRGSEEVGEASVPRQRSHSFGVNGGGGSGRSGSLSDLVGAVSLRRHQNGAASGNGPRPFSEYLTSARSNRSRYTFGAARKVVSHNRQQQQQQQQSGGNNKDYGDYTDANIALSASSQSSDIVYARTSADGRSIISGTTSEPDMQQPQDAGLFERPGFGSVAFFHRHQRTPNQAALMARTLSSLKDSAGPPAQPALLQPPSPSYSRHSGAADSIGTSGSLLRRWRDLPWSAEDLDNLEDDYEDDEGGNGPLVQRKQADLELFLECLGLTECMPALMREQIDLDSLNLCTDTDLQSLGLPLGPRRKILEAVQRRRVAFERPDCLVDLRL